MSRLIVAQLAESSPPGLLLPWARNRGPDDLAESVVTVARNARALFSGWATRAGIEVAPDRSPVGATR